MMIMPVSAGGKKNGQRDRLSGMKTQSLLEVVNKRVLHILSAKKIWGDFEELNR